MPQGGSRQESNYFCCFLKKNGNRIMKISFMIENEVINRGNAIYFAKGSLNLYT